MGARLIIVSNRVAAAEPAGRACAGRLGGGGEGGAEEPQGHLVRLERQGGR